MKDIRELAINSRPMTIGGYENIPTVNVNHMHGSDIGALLCKDQPFAAYYSANKAGQLVFGLRSKAGYEHALDVSVIAKAYGGGGHAHASGFRVNDLNEL